MPTRRLKARIFGGFVALMVAAMALASALVERPLRLSLEGRVVEDLAARARIIAHDLDPAAAPSDLNRRAKELGRLGAMRVTFVAADGAVVGDSDSEPAAMDNHASRPEVAAALAGRPGRSVRFSDTVRRALAYVAEPVPRPGGAVAVVRVSVPVGRIAESRRALFARVILALAAAAVLCALLAGHLARRISRPIEDLRRVADRLAAGDLGARAPLSDLSEPAALGRAMNRMAEQLGERMRTIERQREEQDAVFANMAEGMVAVDGAGRILRANAAAGRLIGFDPAAAAGRPVEEIIRNPDLQAFVRAALSQSGVSEREIILRGEGDRFLQVRGSELGEPGAPRGGVLVVLGDVTRLKRLEVVRREFAANASHELKTPVTAIRGCVETLEEGALERPDEARRFLASIARQARRLEALVDDLLSLARIESEADSGQVALERHALRPVLEAAVQALATAAGRKGIEIALDCTPDVVALVEPRLLEQAVANLLDNAVKYSAEGTRVGVAVRLTPGEVEIAVTDRGPGIDRRHLPRIFERFYRVDQARSRALGGTGLGLAIVRHIVLAHRGTVTVESVLGEGSAFRIRLPRIGPALTEN